MSVYLSYIILMGPKGANKSLIDYETRLVGEL